MLFGSDRGAMRRLFREAWLKRRDDRPLQPLEAQLADVVALHPEYHTLLEGDEGALERDYSGADGGTNPFLHMGMHIALREQIGTDRPAGIAALHQRLLQKRGDAHTAEHQMMECLGEALWSAQRSGTAPDEVRYLACLKRLAEG